MIKKMWRRSLPFLLGSFIFGMLSGYQPVYADVSSFVSDRNEALALSKEKYETKNQKLSEPAQRALEKKKEAASQKISECDCENAKDPKNVTTNFIYDDKGRKTYRVDPYCQCMLTEAKAVVKTEGTAKNQMIQWNVRY